MNLTNKDKAQLYHTAVSNYDLATIESMVCENYIQHNPFVPTGRAAFLALIPQLKKHNSKIQNIRIFQDDSHVIMHHLWKQALPFGADEKVAFHILRFDRSGLISEHWSVMADVAKPNLSKRSLIDGPTEITDLENTEKNKALVAKLFTSLVQNEISTYKNIFRDFFQPGFYQHHPQMADGISGFVASKYHRQHKVFGSGNFVLSISEGVHGDRPTAFYDLFRIENDLIAEHWSIYQEIPKTNLANENTMFGF